MSSQIIFKESVVNSLQSLSAIKKNFSLYSSDKRWIHEEIKLDDTTTTATVFEPECNVYLFRCTPEDDLINTISFYKAYKGLTPRQASDPRLWAYLAHYEFWLYMRKRWPVEKAKKDREVEYIRSHYFIHRSSDRMLIRHGIARLWWYGYLTYQENTDDPFYLTKILLSQLDVTRGLLERAFGRNQTVLHGFLKFLAKKPYLLHGNKSRTATRYLYRALTLNGGVCLLDLLSQDDIFSFLEKNLDRFEKDYKKGIIDDEDETDDVDLD